MNICALTSLLPRMVWDASCTPEEAHSEPEPEALGVRYTSRFRNTISPKEGQVDRHITYRAEPLLAYGPRPQILISLFALERLIFISTFTAISEIFCSGARRTQDEEGKSYTTQEAVSVSLCNLV